MWLHPSHTFRKGARCTPCIERGYECRTSKDHRDCAYCTSQAGGLECDYELIKHPRASLRGREKDRSRRSEKNLGDAEPSGARGTSSAQRRSTDDEKVMHDLVHELRREVLILRARVEALEKRQGDRPDATERNTVETVKEKLHANAEQERPRLVGAQAESGEGLASPLQAPQATFAKPDNELLCRLFKTADENDEADPGCSEQLPPHSHQGRDPSATRDVISWEAPQSAALSSHSHSQPPSKDRDSDHSPIDTNRLLKLRAAGSLTSEHASPPSVVSSRHSSLRESSSRRASKQSLADTNRLAKLRAVEEIDDFESDFEEVDDAFLPPQKMKYAFLHEQAPHRSAKAAELNGSESEDTDDSGPCDVLEHSVLKG